MYPKSLKNILKSDWKYIGNGVMRRLSEKTAAQIEFEEGSGEPWARTLSLCGRPYIYCSQFIIRIINIERGEIANNAIAFSELFPDYGDNLVFGEYGVASNKQIELLSEEELEKLAALINNYVEIFE